MSCGIFEDYIKERQDEARREIAQKIQAVFDDNSLEPRDVYEGILEIIAPYLKEDKTDERQKQNRLC